MDKHYYVYILSNNANSTLYTGITSDLKRRVFKHKEKLQEGFTSRYNIDKLVYYEMTNDVKTAIQREKQIKGGSRSKKFELVVSKNPGWRDLYEEL